MTDSIHIVGVSYANQDGTSRQEVLRWSNPGDPVRLEREAGNPHDENAIRVIALKHGAQIGYVPRDLAAALVKEREFPASGAIEELFGGTTIRPGIGCRIKVEWPE